MCLFCKKKKKNYTALKVVAIVFSALAALAAAYVIFDKFFKEKLVKFIEDKKAAKACCCECDEACDEDVEATEDTAEALDVTAEAIADAE